ncbi:hypothetical protein PRIPAC_92724 [Pristionchus pacificus]|uniref:Uncharacterized protein n=1 Tax=Pristionchus pacificus TaxID=54126 RepID=A0A2A6BBI5_PRIPA|nr:hypothetical protein PRIPAC_92724 [Pristionchus pacificus]|eukprot:PDM63245.1 hypothetical protein PRIPAC_50460 [Pristionchus pacificus]
MHKIWACGSIPGGTRPGGGRKLPIRSLNFYDTYPQWIDFASILKACPYNQIIVVHCHNTGHKCRMHDHEHHDDLMDYRNYLKKFGHISNPYQDCRATMYDCLRSVLATSHNDQCTATVLREREKVNIYKQITGDGDSINIAYPIAASRVLDRCPKLWVDLKICYKNFFECDVETKRIRDERYVNELRRACGNNPIYCKHPTDITEHPEYNFYDELRRIAFGMILNRVRVAEYEPVTPYFNV